MLKVMGRPGRFKVNSFAHKTKNGNRDLQQKALFVLENRFGNDGYAFFYKLKEILGGTEKHFLDCDSLMDWEFILAETRVKDEIAKQMLDLLVTLEIVDEDLWQNGIIFSKSFIDDFALDYERRNVNKPTKNEIIALCQHKAGLNNLIPTESDFTQTESNLNGLSADFLSENFFNAILYIYNNISNNNNNSSKEKIKKEDLKDIKLICPNCNLDNTNYFKNIDFSINNIQEMDFFCDECGFNFFKDKPKKKKVSDGRIREIEAYWSKTYFEQLNKKYIVIDFGKWGGQIKILLQKVEKYLKVSNGDRKAYDKICECINQYLKSTKKWYVESNYSFNVFISDFNAILNGEMHEPARGRSPTKESRRSQISDGKGYQVDEVY